MDPVTEKCVWTNEQMNTPIEKLQEYIEKAQQGTFIPDRENDELTEALGNPEHPGRTRGTSGSLSWKAGFPDASGYKRRERKKKKELTQLTRGSSQHATCRSYTRSYPAISAEKQRCFHRAASAGACLDGSC